MKGAAGKMLPKYKQASPQTSHISPKYKDLLMRSFAPLNPNVEKDRRRFKATVFDPWTPAKPVVSSLVRLVPKLLMLGILVLYYSYSTHKAVGLGF